LTARCKSCHKLVPGPYSPGDYETSDQALVFAAAAQLSSLAGSYPAAQIGNASYAKLDINLTPRNQLALRYNSSRYWGSNNVFLGPVTYDSISDNGTEDVSTDTGSAALISGVTPRLISHLRAQFSRDLRESYTNTTKTLVKVTDIIDGIGRSDQLPRATREHRGQLAETLSLDTSRHSFKFGGDSLITWIYDYYPSQQSGEYLFDIIKVDPFTFEPMEAGLPLTPLRAYAHSVPKYYLQSFGPSSSNPNSNDYAAFAQDTIRVTDHLAINLGVRWERSLGSANFHHRWTNLKPAVSARRQSPFQSSQLRPASWTGLFHRQDSPPGNPRRLWIVLRSHSSDL